MKNPFPQGTSAHKLLESLKESELEPYIDTGGDISLNLKGGTIVYFDCGESGTVYDVGTYLKRW